MTNAHLPRGTFAVMVVLAFAAVLATSTSRSAPPGAAANPAPSGAAASAAGPASLTLANLQAAFAAEKNAEYRYELYAKQADREGYHGVASLFRACARAEGVHAEGDVHALAWLQGEARVQLEKVYADSTTLNLTYSIVDEGRQLNEVYPDRLGRARAERQTPAMRAFTYALGAEEDHLGLMIDALGRLPSETRAQTFYVCPTCGRVYATTGAPRCASCFTPAKRFLKVS